MISTTARRCFLLPLLLCTGCAMLDPGGSGTETTTGVMGAITDDSGNLQANVRVQLLPDTYDPVRDTALVPADTTDSLGSYSFMHVGYGMYRVQAVHLRTGTRALVSGVHVMHDPVVVATDTLQAPGSIKVSLPVGAISATGYVYIPGTTVFSFLGNRTDFVVLDSAPAGLVPEIAYSSATVSGATAIRYNIPVRSNDTTPVRNPLWKYARTLALNTTVTGADVTGNVMDFPVLIRLNAGTFDFLRARPDGADVRFTKSDNTLLPYEIERWDPVAGLAEVWVRLDTVLGNDSAQSIVMYWGNPEASDSSNSSSVFDTTAGFQGVWHLNDGMNDPILDATLNGYHGVSPDTARPQVGEGAVGSCRVFDGVRNYITMPYTAAGKLNFPENGWYTVSAWVNLDTLDNAPHLVVAKGYEQYFLRLTYFPVNAPLWEFSEFNQNNTWQACTASATGRMWTLLTGVRQGNRQLLYCNGVLVDDTPSSYQSSTLSRNTSYDLSIGKFLMAVNVSNFDEDSYCFFKGAIDEVRIQNTAQSPDWVKLCYMNQRADDRLVVFK